MDVSRWVMWAWRRGRAATLDQDAGTRDVVGFVAGRESERRRGPFGPVSGGGPVPVSVCRAFRAVQGVPFRGR